MKQFEMIWNLIFNKRKFDNYWSKKITDEKEKSTNLLIKQFEEKLLLLSRETQTKLLSRDFQQPLLRIAISQDLEVWKPNWTIDGRSPNIEAKEFRYKGEKIAMKVMYDSFVDHSLQVESIKRKCTQEVAKYLVDNDFLNFNFREFYGEHFVEVSINTYER